MKTAISASLWPGRPHRLRVEPRAELVFLFDPPAEHGLELGAASNTCSPIGVNRAW